MLTNSRRLDFSCKNKQVCVCAPFLCSHSNLVYLLTWKMVFTHIHKDWMCLCCFSFCLKYKSFLRKAFGAPLMIWYEWIFFCCKLHIADRFFLILLFHFQLLFQHYYNYGRLLNLRGQTKIVGKEIWSHILF